MGSRSGRVKSQQNLRQRSSKLRPDCAGPASEESVNVLGSKEKSACSSDTAVAGLLATPLTPPPMPAVAAWIRQSRPQLKLLTNSPALKVLVPPNSVKTVLLISAVVAFSAFWR